eukprot:611404-Rhodomonas_salina.1
MFAWTGPSHDSNLPAGFLQRCGGYALHQETRVSQRSAGRCNRITKTSWQIRVRLLAETQHENTHQIRGSFWQRTTEVA